MIDLHIKNTMIASVVGIIVFTILLIWNPLKEAPEQRVDVKYPNLEEATDVIRNMPADPKLRFPKSLLTPPSGEMDPDAVKEICTRMAKVRKNPEAYAEVKRLLVATNERKEGLKLLANLNEFKAFTDELCENGKPKP